MRKSLAKASRASAIRQSGGNASWRGKEKGSSAGLPTPQPLNRTEPLNHSTGKLQYCTVLYRVG